MGIQVKETGDFSKKTPFSLLYQAMKQKFKGVIVLASPKEKHSIVIANQKVKTPSAVVDEAQLGKYLFEQKIVQDDLFMKIKQFQKEKNIPFYQAVIQTNAAQVDQIQSFIESRIQSIVDQVLSWQQGKYIIVEQIPKDIVPIEISDSLHTLLFQAKLRNNVQNKSVLQPVEIEFENPDTHPLENLHLDGQQQKMVQVLQKDKNPKSLSSIESIDMEEAKAFAHTLMDFEYITLKKVKEDKSARDEKFASFDFAKVYNEYENLNHYEMLGFTQDVAAADIPPQYFAIAKKYHPDRFQNSKEYDKVKVEKVFSKISESYQTLKDPTKRKEYDDKLAGKGGDEIDVEQVMESESSFLDGMDCTRRGQFEKAIECFEKAIGLYNEEPEYFIRLGWAQYRHGLKSDNAQLVDQGKKAIEGALGGDRVLDDVYYYQGMILKNDKKYEKAKLAFKRALQENENHIQAGQEFRAVDMLLEKRSATKKKGWFK